MDCTPERAAEIVDALPAQLRMPDLAVVLGVSLGHIEKMRGNNRVPKPDQKVGGGFGTPVWHRENIRSWLTDRLVNRSVDIAAALKSANKTRSMLGYIPTNLAQRPLYPFLGIGD